MMYVSLLKRPRGRQALSLWLTRLSSDDDDEERALALHRLSV